MKGKSWKTPVKEKTMTKLFLCAAAPDGAVFEYEIDTTEMDKKDAIDLMYYISVGKWRNAASESIRQTYEDIKISLYQKVIDTYLVDRERLNELFDILTSKTDDDIVHKRIEIIRDEVIKIFEEKQASDAAKNTARQLIMFMFEKYDVCRIGLDNDH